MPRYALLLEYDGTDFIGWQQQAVGLSVQAVLERAVLQLGEAVRITAAGRTDAGVHAEAQVAHLDLAREIAPEKLADALNFHVKPHRVAVRRVAVVPAGWNARFSAVGRRYRYVILNRRARAALADHRVWHVPAPLDLAAMTAAAAYLLGSHDFTSFRASSCQAASPVRTLDRLTIVRIGESVAIEAGARSFLHHQVRNIVGSLKLVGEGRWAPARMVEVLAARRRSAAGPTAPACGLCLTGVGYSADPFGAWPGVVAPGVAPGTASVRAEPVESGRTTSR